MLNYALIAVGGAIGSLARAWLGAVMLSLTGPAFPWGTLLINAAGSFAIGLLAAATMTAGRLSGAAPEWRAFAMVGLCGGFTTFSSFSLQGFDLLREGRPWSALGYAVLSVTLCLATVTAGYALGRAG